MSTALPTGDRSRPTLEVPHRTDGDGNRAVSPSTMSTVSNPFLSPAPSPAPSPNHFLTPSPSRASSQEMISDALRPDPGTEADFIVHDSPFAFSPGQMNKLFNPKSSAALRALGGLRGIEQGLRTNVESGLGVDETVVPRIIDGQDATGSSAGASAGFEDRFADRIRVFGRNVLPAKKATPLWKLTWRAFNDKILWLLTAAAVISLALGLYETFGVDHAEGSPPPVDWVEGVAICVAIVIVTGVGSVNDWQKERAFVKLSAKKDDRLIKVIRSGRSDMVNVVDVLVGDVIHIEPGDLVPVDGILISGHELKCDESSATGESDALKKTAAPQARDADDPFILSGSKVLTGTGTFLATSVGVHSSYGKIMMAVRTEMEATPLQKKLEGLAVAIAKLGAGAAGLLFTVLLCRFLAALPGDTRSPAEKASSFLDILIVAVTIVVVAVPEGLPLAVTLALAFATTRMFKENNLVRVLRACETMGNATAICSDKTGTLTTNRMTVVSGTFGSTSFEKATASRWASGLSSATREAVVQAVAVNSTAFEGQDGIFVGSKTETALLQLARDHLGMQSLAETRAKQEVVRIFPFDSAKKCMGVVIRRNGRYRLLVKGASEILLGYCAFKADDVVESELTDADRDSLLVTVNSYASQSLRTIGIVYRDLDSWPADVEFASVLTKLVFLGVVGIQDPVRDGVPEAVRKAQAAGVFVRMVTGDNAVTARAIATECGIYTDGVVMEGPDFRKLSEEQMDLLLPKLQVLARSSPDDKRRLVERLKVGGETVAVTGDGTNDAPALKMADVGFSMGISGTEVAKEASAIILLDDNFASIITALKWGRAVNDAVQKFLQFQITVNITAVFLAFLTAVSSSRMQSVLTAVQLLWINLVMDTLAALALATDPPTDRILDRAPQPKSAPLITLNMWKMIIGQAVFQFVVTLVLHFGGASMLGYDEPSLRTMVFNTFVWMQIFNQWNNRRLDNKLNIMEGVQRNGFFLVINAFMVGAQIAIVFVGGQAFSIRSGGINGVQWAICLVLAVLCIPWAVVVRLFPDAWFAAVARTVGAPAVVTYRALARFYTRLRRPRRSRQDGDGDSRKGESVVVEAPTIQVEDAEKGQ